MTNLDLLALGRRQLQAGQLADAERTFRQILATNPEHPESLHLLGVIAAHTGRNDLAVDFIAKAIAADGAVAEFHNSMGNVILALGRVVDAAAHYRKAVTLAPNYAEAHFNLGIALQALEELEEATAQYRRVLALSPNTIVARLNLGAAYAMQGKFETALEEFQRVLVHAPELGEARRNIGQALVELGRLEEAIAEFRQAVAINPKDAAAEASLGTAFRQQGRLDEAISHYRRALAISPDYVKARIDLGLAFAEQLNLADARIEAESAARFSEQPGFPHYSLGVLFARCGLAEAARDQFNLSLRDDPKDKQGAHLSLAALGFEPIPERASSAQLHQFYDLRAAWWDRSEVYERPYHAATSLARVFRNLVPDPGNLEVLDAGCGAGLIWMLIGRKVRALDGVDRSAGMLMRAKQKNIYRELHEADLVEFMAARPRSYDVITSGAVLLHFSDLKPVFAAAATTLRDNGLFLFTLFHNPADENGVAIGSFDGGQVQTASFVHGRDYIRRAAAAAGFTVESMEQEEFDRYEDKTRTGLVVALRRRS